MNILLAKAFELIAEQIAKEAVKQGTSSIWKAIGEGIEKLKGTCKNEGLQEPKVTFNIEGDTVINCTIVLNDGKNEISATRGLVNIKESPNQVKSINEQPTEFEYDKAKGTFIANIERYMQEIIENGDLQSDGINWHLTDKWQEMTGRQNEYIYIYIEDGCKYEIVDEDNTVWFSGRFSDNMSMEISNELEQYITQTDDCIEEEHNLRYEEEEDMEW